jgi:hypothetical protein
MSDIFQFDAGSGKFRLVRRHGAPHTPVVGSRLYTMAEIQAAHARQTPQTFQNESHRALACRTCKRLPCTCGVPQPPSLDRIVAMQRERERRT